MDQAFNELMLSAYFSDFTEYTGVMEDVNIKWF